MTYHIDLYDINLLYLVLMNIRLNKETIVKLYAHIQNGGLTIFRNYIIQF